MNQIITQKETIEIPDAASKKDHVEFNIHALVYNIVQQNTLVCFGDERVFAITHMKLEN